MIRLYGKKCLLLTFSCTFEVWHKFFGWDNESNNIFKLKMGYLNN